MKQKLVIVVLLLAQNWLAQKDDLTKVTCTIEVPNVISPNSEVNDVWMVEPTCAVTGFTIEVYNRWGQKIYRQDSLAKDNIIHWSDSDKTPHPAEGSYFYIINYKMKWGEEIIENDAKGSVVLIR